MHRKLPRTILCIERKVKVVMKRYQLTLSVALLFGRGSNAASIHAIDSAPATKIEDLRPFTHLASIPATSNPQTIKFQRVTATKVFTKVKSTFDPGYCELLQFRDPGGSRYCPATRDESPAAAYEVTYSFTGQPLASDEYANGYSTYQFKVYFRPGELTPALRRTLSAGKPNRAELASYFKVTTARLPVQARLIDWANSSLCEEHLVGGLWVHRNRNCRDNIRFKNVTVPSDYITVRVEPVM
jgi:hypothetical protein